jgi:dynein heavy chain 1
MSDILATAIAGLLVPQEEVKALKLFIKNSCLVFLDADESLDQELDKEEYEDYFKAFITDTEKTAIIIVQNKNTIRMLFNMEELPTSGQALSISKRKRQIYDPNAGPTKYSKVLNVLSLGSLETDFNPYDLTQNCIQNTFLPMFNNMKNVNKESKEKEMEDIKNLNLIKKKLSDLQLTLIRNNKMLELTDVTLQYNPTLKGLVQTSKFEGKELKPEDIPKELMDDPAFINGLVDSVNEFKEKTLEFMHIYNEKSFDSVLDEIQFYELYSEKIANLNRTIQSDDIKTILGILKHKKKFASTMDFENEINFNNFYSGIQEINAFMKEIPITELLTANTMENVLKAITDVSNQFGQVLKKVRAYPPNNISNLFKALNKDIQSSIIKIWRDEKLLEMNPDNFKSYANNIKTIFTYIEKFYTESKKDITSKYRNLNRDAVENMNADISSLKTRYKKIENLKDKLSLLMTSIEEVKKNEVQFKEDRGLFTMVDPSQIKDFNKPFEAIDLLNMTKEGDEQLVLAIEANKKLHDEFEGKIIEKITEKLGLAQNDEELYKIYHIYHPFLCKSSGQSSSIKFKEHLVKSLDSKFDDLKEKLKTVYSNSNSRFISEFYDIPQMTGAFIRNQQILDKMKETIDRNLKISNDSKGTGAGDASAQNHRIKQTKNHFDEFSSNNQREEANLTSNFINEFKQQREEIYGESIFAIREKWGSSNEYEIGTNFDDKFIEKVKNMRNIIKQQERVEFGISYNFVKQDWVTFKSASYLKETLNLYNYVNNRLDEKTEKLLANHLKEIQEYIKQNIALKWSDGKMVDQVIKNLATKVNNLETSFNYINQRKEQIDSVLNYLETCEIDSAVFTERIKEIQHVLDELNFKSYSNIHTLVQDLEVSVEKVLKKRLVDIIQQWCVEFEGYRNREIERKLIKENTPHEIKVQNQVIFVEPPIEHANAFWLNHFHSCMGIICNLPKLDPSAFSSVSMTKDKKGTHQMFYHHLLHEIDQTVLNNAYSLVNKIIADADKYTRTWLCYQGLWELEFSDVQKYLKDDINSWQKILNDIRSGRNIFDNSETEIFFGAIRVKYVTVQNKITSKYDQWHKEILNQFGKTLNENLNKFFAIIKQARIKLEKIDFSTGEGTVTAISDLNYCKKNLPKWAAELEHFKDGQKLLEIQKFHFPADWTFSDQIEGDWLVVKQILAKKSEDFDRLFDELKGKLDAEEQAIKAKMEDVAKIWEEKKPYDGDLGPKEATEILTIVENKLKDVAKRYEDMNKAKELMDLIPSDTSLYESRKEEIEGLKEVWEEIAKVWKKIDAMADTTLPASQPTKMIKELDAVIDEMNGLPNKFRSYEAFTKKKDNIKLLKKMTVTINNLKSETFKDRHWKELLRKINLKKSQNDLTIGELWRLDLGKYQKVIDTLLGQAAGEFVLEDMIRKIKEYWQNFDLDLVRYQNKCKLIRGWDDLFGKG